MSTTYTDAHKYLIENVYAPVFFHKLAADYGIQPSTEEEARELLSLNEEIEALEHNHQVKQAQERVSLISQARQTLGSLSGKQVPVQSGATYQDAEISKVAADLSQNETVRNAALLFADYMNQVNG